MESLQATLQQGVPHWRNLWHETCHGHATRECQVYDLREDRDQTPTPSQGGGADPALETREQPKRVHRKIGGRYQNFGPGDLRVAAGTTKEIGKLELSSW